MRGAHTNVWVAVPRFSLSGFDTMRRKAKAHSNTGRLPLIGTRWNVNNLVPTKGDCNGEAKVPRPKQIISTSSGP